MISIFEMRTLLPEAEVKARMKRDSDLRPDGRVRDARRDLVEAAQRTHEAGYQKIDAYSPFPDRRTGGSDRHFTRTRVPLVVLIGGILGGLIGIPAAVLDFGDQLSHQCRRAAATFLAGVHRRHF